MFFSTKMPFSCTLILFCACFCTITSYGKTYKFSAIEKLPDQAVAIIVMAEVYQQLGLRLEVEMMPGLRAQKAANDGLVDGEIMRIFSYGDETPNVIRVPTPFYTVKTVAYINHKSKIDIRDKSDLIDYKIVIVRGVKHTDVITKDLPGHNIKMMSEPESIMAYLQKGRADIALTNPLEGELAIKKLGYIDLVLIDHPLASFPLHHYVHKRNANLVPLIDLKLKQLIKNGEMSVLLQKAEIQIIQDWLEME